MLCTPVFPGGRGGRKNPSICESACYTSRNKSGNSRNNRGAIIFCSIEDRPVVESPFPHIVLDQAFEPAVFDALREQFPTAEYFEKSHRIMDGRYNLMRGNPLLDTFLDESDAWNKAFEHMNSDEFALGLAEAFRPEIEENADALDPGQFDFVDWYEPPRAESTIEVVEPPPLPKNVSENSLFLNLDIARAEQGYNRGPHTDARHKVAVMLVFFTDHDPAEGGQFRLYDYHGDDDPPPRSAPLDQVTIAREIRPRPNKGILFPNSPTAYHAVTEFQRTYGLREFLYASVASVACEDVWAS